jgi:hypothetical protein
MATPCHTPMLKSIAKTQPTDRPTRYKTIAVQLEVKFSANQILESLVNYSEAKTKAKRKPISSKTTVLKDNSIINSKDNNNNKKDNKDNWIYQRFDQRHKRRFKSA